MFDWLRRMLPLGVGPQRIVEGIKRSTVDPPKRGTREHLEVYETSPWARAVGEKVSNAVACCDFKLLAVKGPGGKYVRNERMQKSVADQRLMRLKLAGSAVTEIENSVFLTALDNPNPFMDRVSLFKITELHLDFVGDAFWLKQRNALGTPVGFWPIPPHWVAEMPTVERPTFRVSWKSWQAIIPASEIQWFHEAAPADPYTRGTGIGWSLADEIQVDEYAAKMASAFFFNRARPDFIFVTGQGEDETRRLEMDWNNRLQGWWRAHRPYFLAGDTPDLQKQIREFQQPTMEQLVYPGLRKVQRDIVLQTWGVAPELFGIVENSNRAVIEAAEYLFTKYVVRPKSERLRSGLQRLYIEDYDERGIVHVESPVAEDKEYQLNVMKAAPWVFGESEWRARAGFAGKREAGDRGLVPLNSFITDDPLDAEKRPQAAAPAEPRPEEEPAAEPKEPKEDQPA